MKRQRAVRSEPRRPTVSIVGAGRVGTALALALAQCGYRVEALVAHRKSHAERAARFIPTKPLALSSAELDRLPESSLLFITTPDDLIEETAASIAALIREKQEQRTALHASGALSSGVLKSLRDVGFRTGSMHPLVAVSHPVAGAERLRVAYFCIEGEAGASSAARRIVRDLGARSFSVNTTKKALYHAAALTASGHMVALFDIATEMLLRCGLKEKDARSVLMPLVESNVANLKELATAKALTGTFARADMETVRRHLGAIRREEIVDALAAYRILGRRSVRLAERRGVNGEALKAILELLDDVAEE
ncbi:MAG TPA: Rossmann-like and DUF2520 domain-containing protein [Pyrinomonadaceae bacterium]|nr:Rossmann-like and DUF2520 domain-containing protein [Pyrinomonadaceae bacterium]